MPDAYDTLRKLLKDTQGALVAFSGGVDSSLLLVAARDALGDKVLAVTVDSPLHPDEELTTARRTAATLGVRHLVVETNELADQAFCANPSDRCYLCKSKRFESLMEMARKEQIASVVEGSNRDDLGDYRPGMRAASELGVRSPFIELNLGKDDIRRMAREQGLSVWDKPSAACLASRIPYGGRITLERIRRIDSAEARIRSLGFSQLRVRDHGNVARIEVEPDQMDRLFDPALRDQVVSEVKDTGFTWVCLDLSGYRTGAMNETLDRPDRHSAVEEGPSPESAK